MKKLHSLSRLAFLMLALLNSSIGFSAAQQNAATVSVSHPTAILIVVACVLIVGLIVLLVLNAKRRRARVSARPRGRKPRRKVIIIR